MQLIRHSRYYLCSAGSSKEGKTIKLLSFTGGDSIVREPLYQGILCTALLLFFLCILFIALDILMRKDFLYNNFAIYNSQRCQFCQYEDMINETLGKIIKAIQTLKMFN